MNPYVSKFEKILDRWVAGYGVLLKDAKASRENQFNGQKDHCYQFKLSLGYECIATIYQHPEDDAGSVQPYLAVFLSFAQLSSAFNQQAVLASIARKSSELYSPLKVCLFEDKVSICLRGRADKLDAQYVKQLLNELVDFSSRYLQYANKHYGLMPLDASAAEDQRVLQ